MGHGSGGASYCHDFWISRKPLLPISKDVVSEIYECDFQMLHLLSEIHTFLELVRRTFQSRIENPIGHVFISYALEPSGGLSIYYSRHERIMIKFLDRFCGHRSNGNSCDICSLKQISNRLHRVLNHEETVSNKIFMELGLKYLVLSYETQVYYQLGSHQNQNLLPRLMSRLSHCMLDPRADHTVLLDYYPRLSVAFNACLDDLSLTKHVFSSTRNSISWMPSEHDSQKIEFTQHRVSFSVSFFWESCYDKGLSAAQSALT